MFVDIVGCASILMNKGNTIHNTFKIPIPIHSDSSCNIPIQSDLAKILKMAVVIWVDEMVLAHRWILECIDRFCRDIQTNQALSKLPFGGKTTLLSGDFRQGLPIIKRGSKADIINACYKSSYLWKRTEVLHLKRNMRVSTTTADELEFLNFQQDIGDGKLILDDNGCIDLPTYLTENVNSIEDLSKFVFGDNFEYITEPGRSILTLTNADALAINDYVGGFLEGEWNMLISADSVPDNVGDFSVPSDVLHTLTPSGAPPHVLKI
jgi:ATP-dependent DNA helicase PIF1